MAEQETTGGGAEQQPPAAPPEAPAPNEPAPPTGRSHPTIRERVGRAVMTVPNRVIAGAGAATQLPGDTLDIARSPFTKQRDFGPSLIDGAGHAASVAGAAEAIADPGGVTARAAAREARGAIRDGINDARHPHPETPPPTAPTPQPPTAPDPTTVPESLRGADPAALEAARAIGQIARNSNGVAIPLANQTSGQATGRLT